MRASKTKIEISTQRANEILEQSLQLNLDISRVKRWAHHIIILSF